MKSLEKVYFDSKQYSELDYLLLENDNNFDWDQFFVRFHENYIYEIHEPEYFIITKDEQRINNNRHIEYEFHVKDFAFISIVDIILCDNEIQGLSEDIVKYQQQKINTNIINNLLQAYKNNPDKLVVKYQFRDASNNTFITNKLGNLSFFVLRNAMRCLIDSFYKVGIDNVFCLEFHVAKNEIKRLDLYKKMIQRNSLVSHLFKNSFTDTVTDDKYATFYIWR